MELRRWRESSLDQARALAGARSPASSPSSSGPPITNIRESLSTRAQKASPRSSRSPSSVAEYNTGLISRCSVCCAGYSACSSSANPTDGSRRTASPSEMDVLLIGQRLLLIGQRLLLKGLGKRAADQAARAEGPTHPSLGRSPRAGVVIDRGLKARAMFDRIADAVTGFP